MDKITIRLRRLRRLKYITPSFLPSADVFTAKITKIRNGSRGSSPLSLTDFVCSCPTVRRNLK
jgi:hypothetical protein